HTLIGYTDQPSVMQALVYAATLAFIVIATRLAAGCRPQARAPAE
ncbi:MAG: iron permease, partial [Methylocystis sp.]|nr:iron permease [Methylocystis sp.]